MNAIFGAGGFAKEVAWIMDDVARLDPTIGRVDAFIASDDAPNVGSSIHGAAVLAESDFFALYRGSPVNVFIAVGSPLLKLRLQQKCATQLEAVTFPSLVHPSVMYDHRDKAIIFGSGAIVCAGTILTTDIKIGDFSHLNLNCTVGHDAVIGTFCTLSPGVHVSGGVNLEPGCFVGTGAVLLENVRVPAASVIGAGATVIKTLAEPGTYVGTPARIVA